MDQTEEWVSITEAAARLTAAGDPIDRSSLSRYLKQHGEALELKPDGRQNLVNFSALQAHRGENIRLRPWGGAPRPAAAANRAPVLRTQTDGLARKINADAEMREMDLARRRGELTSVTEVGQAAADAIALMKSAFDRAVDTTAASISVRYGWDERKVRIELKSYARVGLEAFNRSLRQRLDEEARARMAEDGGFEGEAAGGLQ